MRDYSVVKERQADVYIGVDVFARGKVVGGKWETNKVPDDEEALFSSISCSLILNLLFWSPGSGNHQKTRILCSHLCSRLGVRDSR